MIKLENWMTESTVSKLKEISDKIPEVILQRAIELIIILDEGERDYNYRNRLINIIYDSITKPQVCSTCQGGYGYDTVHEFSLLLDGWVWKVEVTDGTNIETDSLHMKSIKQ